MADMARRMRGDPLQLEPTLELLADLDWVSRLDEGDAARHVLLCDPASTLLTPLLERSLLGPGSASARFMQASRLREMTLGQALT